MKINWRQYDVDAAGAIALVVIALVGYLFGIHSPLNDSMSYDKAHRRQQEMSLTTASLRAKTASLQSQLKETSNRLAESGSRPPDAHAMDNLMSQLQNTASRCGLVLERIQPMGMISHEGYQVNRLLIEGKGTFSAIHAWLAQLELDVPYLDTTNFSIRASKETSEDGTTVCHFECSQKAYIAPARETMTTLARRP